METGKSKVSPKAGATLAGGDVFQRHDLEAEYLQGTWRMMARYQEGTKPMVVVACPVCLELGMLSDHKVLANGTVSPSMDCQNPDCSYHAFITLDNWDLGVLDNQGEVNSMGDLDNLRQQKKEWELWKDLVQLLKDSGTVTDADGLSKESARVTVGQRVMAGIRAWGDSLVELRGVRPPIPDPVMLSMVTQLVPGVITQGATDGNSLPQIVKTAKGLAEEILKQCSP